MLLSGLVSCSSINIPNNHEITMPTPNPSYVSGFPLWNGHESIAEYAARAGISDSELHVDLGNGVSMTMVLIPAGRFLMGSPDSELERYDIEGPQREVMITRPYYLGAYEVTQEQYEQIMDVNPSKFVGAKNPVEKVSWVDANEFCNRLSKKTDRMIRLPTEAEWEYACRAGTTSPFNVGVRINTKQANFDGGGSASCIDKVRNPKGWLWEKLHVEKDVYGSGKWREIPVAVSSFAPNAWGLYDMHGNVSEWCSDWYAPYPHGPDIDPVGPALGASDERAIRGGSWNDKASGIRSAARSAASPTVLYSTLGVRVVCVLGNSENRQK
jgi:formylglycine-generating enzyme required for sulfatase activity